MVLFPREELNPYNQFDLELYEYVIKSSLAELQKQQQQQQKQKYWNNDDDEWGRRQRRQLVATNWMAMIHFLSTISLFLQFLLPTMSNILHVYYNS